MIKVIPNAVVLIRKWCLSEILLYPEKITIIQNTEILVGQKHT